MVELDESAALVLEAYSRRRQRLSKKYAARLGRSRQAVLSHPLGERRSAEIELPFVEVARDRGSLAWCQQLADRVRGLVREIHAAERPLSRPA